MHVGRRAFAKNAALELGSMIGRPFRQRLENATSSRTYFDKSVY